MNCELAHERIVMAAYGELADDAAHELDRHLATCPACSQEKDQLQTLRLLADVYPLQEPDPNLMARSRMRLEEALDAIPPKRWFERLLQRVRNNAASLQAAPIAASLLLIIGGGAGSLVGYHVAESHAARLGDAAAQSDQANTPQAPDVPPDANQPGEVQATTTTRASLQPDSVPQRQPGPAVNGEIANISSIVRQPDSDMVEVHYNQLVPLAARGSLDDPQIRQLLMLASA